MIYSEFLRLLRNRQLIGLLIGWLLLSILLSFGLKTAFLNPIAYGFLDYKENYFVYLNFYLGHIYPLSFVAIILSVGLVMNEHKPLDVNNRVLMLPVNPNELVFNVFLVLQGFYLFLVLIIITVVSVMLYMTFGSKLPGYEIIMVTAALTLLHMIGISTVITFYFLLFSELKSTLVALICAIIIWIASLILPYEILPLQWAYHLFAAYSHEDYFVGYLVLSLFLIVIGPFILKHRGVKVTYFR